jgi:hypothetical protein
VVISTREGAYKTRNLRRDPTVVLCVLSDDFFGPWIQVEGTAQIVSLPEAMERLVDYYRRISGEHPDWDDYAGRCSATGACWFASPSTRRAQPTPASRYRPSPGSTGGGSHCGSACALRLLSAGSPRWRAEAPLVRLA